MIHKITGTNSAGRQVCVCGETFTPAGVMTHLYEVTALLTEETELLKRHILALHKSRTFGGIVDENGKRLL